MAGKNRKTDPSIDVALPIVPMLDMSFQLLFFFIITFNPSKLDGQMTMNLPASGEAKAKSQDQVDLSKQSDTELDVPSDFVVAVKSYESNLTLSIRDAEKVYEVGSIEGLDRKTSDEQRVAMAGLLNKLSEALKTKLEEKKKDNPTKAADNVKIEANSAMRYSTLIGVMDACLRGLLASWLRPTAGSRTVTKRGDAGNRDLARIQPNLGASRWDRGGLAKIRGDSPGVRGGLAKSRGGQGFADSPLAIHGRPFGAARLVAPKGRSLIARGEAWRTPGESWRTPGESWRTPGESHPW